MKFIIFLAGLALAGYAGYQVEPSLRITLTGKSHTSDSTAQDKPAPAPEIDFSTITPEQLPAEVTLLSDVGFSDDATGLRMTLKAGAAAKLVRVVDDIVIIRIGTTEYITSVPISQTDLVKRLLNPTATEQPAEQPEPPAETPATTPTPEATPAPTPAPGPDPSFPESEPAPAPEPTPTPAPAPSPTPEPTPTPAPTTEPTPTSQPATDVNVVAIMRQSLEKGEIKEFTVAQVKSWKAEPQETVDGGTFDTGSVTYEQETIFGLKTIIAKAYIRNGKVERWIWPKSGLTIQ